MEKEGKLPEHSKNECHGLSRIITDYLFKYRRTIWKMRIPQKWKSKTPTVVIPACAFGVYPELSGHPVSIGTLNGKIKEKERQYKTSLMQDL